MTTRETVALAVLKTLLAKQETNTTTEAAALVDAAFKVAVLFEEASLACDEEHA